MSRSVVVFTKPARPGEVKTRLIGDLSAQDAADLHAAFIDDVCSRLRDWGGPVSIAWALGAGEETPSEPYPGFRQEGADLGERLFHGLARALESAEQAVAVGSDHPDLPRERWDEAFDHLDQGTDVVLGPADDGGYYLVGVARGSLRRRLFEGIAWSTDAVLATTLERCRELRLSVGLLAMESDVDTPSDLKRLIGRLRGGSRAHCPATCRTLGRLSLWPQGSW